MESKDRDIQTDAMRVWGILGPRFDRVKENKSPADRSGARRAGTSGLRRRGSRQRRGQIRHGRRAPHTGTDF
jgi:hypothetical protein